MTTISTYDATAWTADHRYIGPAESEVCSCGAAVNTDGECAICWQDARDGFPGEPTAYTFDAQATADALAILQRASAACTHVESVYRMTHSARALLNAEMAEYFRGR